MSRLPPRASLFPYTTLFRSERQRLARVVELHAGARGQEGRPRTAAVDKLGQPLGVVEGGAGSVLRSSGRRVRRRLVPRSEEHTSELQSRRDLVCRLLLEKKK